MVVTSLPSVLNRYGTSFWSKSGILHLSVQTSLVSFRWANFQKPPIRNLVCSDHRWKHKILVMNHISLEIRPFSLGRSGQSDIPVSVWHLNLGTVINKERWQLFPHTKRQILELLRLDEVLKNDIINTVSTFVIAKLSVIGSKKLLNDPIKYWNSFSKFV